MSEHFIVGVEWLTDQLHNEQTYLSIDRCHTLFRQDLLKLRLKLININFLLSLDDKKYLEEKAWQNILETWKTCWIVSSIIVTK